MLPFLIILPTKDGSIPDAAELAANGIVISSAVEMQDVQEQQHANTPRANTSTPVHPGQTPPNTLKSSCGTPLAPALFLAESEGRLKRCVKRLKNSLR